jgi:hypothetical protein
MRQFPAALQAYEAAQREASDDHTRGALWPSSDWWITAAGSATNDCQRAKQLRIALATAHVRERQHLSGLVPVSAGAVRGAEARAHQRARPHVRNSPSLLKGLRPAIAELSPGDVRSRHDRDGRRSSAAARELEDSHKLPADRRA